MTRKTVDDYTFHWEGLELCVTPALKKADLDPGLALDLSVVKWRFFKDVDNIAQVSGGATRTCGLCCMFWSRTCSRCIIRQASGKPCCVGTPFEAFVLNGARRYAEAEYQFLLALQAGGVEKGRAWLEEWRATVE